VVYHTIDLIAKS